MNRAKGNGLWPWIVRFKRFLYIATGKGEKKDQRHINDSNRKIKKLISVMMKIETALFFLQATVRN